MTTNPSPDQAQHTAASAKAILEGKYPSEFLGRCAQCLDNTHLDGTCNFGLKQDCLLHKAQEYERRQAQKFLDSLPSTGETARSEDVAVPRADLCIVAALAWEGHPSHTSIEAIRRIEAALAAAPRPDGTVEEALRLIVKSAVDYAGLSAPDTKLDFIIASIVEKLRWHQKALEFFRPTPTGDVAAKLAEIGQALQTWREPFGNYEQTFHSYCKFLLPLTERAAALEQENERLTAIMRDATDTIQQFVRTNNEGNGASSGAFIARSRTNPPRSGRRPMSDPYEEYIDPQCAAEIHRLQAELSAARAEAEQAREKAIEEAAVICTNEAELRLGRAEKPWAGDEYIQPFSQAMVQASKGFTANELAKRILTLSATTPKGEE